MITYHITRAINESVSLVLAGNGNLLCQAPKYGPTTSIIVAFTRIVLHLGNTPSYVELPHEGECKHGQQCGSLIAMCMIRRILKLNIPVGVTGCRYVHLSDEIDLIDMHVQHAASDEDIAEMYKRVKTFIQRNLPRMNERGLRCSAFRIDNAETINTIIQTPDLGWMFGVDISKSVLNANAPAFYPTRV